MTRKAAIQRSPSLGRYVVFGLVVALLMYIGWIVTKLQGHSSKSRIERQPSAEPAPIVRPGGDLVAPPPPPAAVAPAVVPPSPPPLRKGEVPYGGIMNCNKQPHLCPKVHALGVPPPKFPHPRIAIFFPMNWPQDKGRVKAADETWARHADIIYYVTAKEKCAEMRADDFLADSTKKKFLCLDMKHSDEKGEGHSRNIWEKSWKSWLNFGGKHLEEADFFMKTDSDSFVAVESLRAYLSYFDPDKPWYFGHTLFNEWYDMNIKYNAGPGYVISREALRRVTPLVKSMPASCKVPFSCCHKEGPNEDPHMGACLNDAKIFPTNTIDSVGRNRFLIFRREDHEIIPREQSWYWHLKPKHMKDLKGCCYPYPFVMHNYKDQYPAMIDNYKKLEQMHHVDPFTAGGVRVLEEPDYGPFLYNPDDLDFKIDNEVDRNSCKVTGC